MKNISFIISEFGIKSELIKYKKISAGHINDTYKIYSSEGKFILQKINTNIFKQPEKVMQNIDIALSHIKKEMRLNGENSNGKFPDYLKSGNNNYIKHNGFWRIYKYLENTTTLDKFESKDIIEDFGRLLGNFHKYTKTADITKLNITISNFHNIKENLSGLLNLLKHDNFYKYNLYLDFYNYYLKNSYILTTKQLVHNDVKCSNILLSISDFKPCAIIDLDTIMPGFAAFDFGDAVRSSCTDNNKINLFKLSAFSKGYFSTGYKLSTKACSLGLLSITAELSARYLHDYMTDENYFKNINDFDKLNKSDNLAILAKNILTNISEIEKSIEKSKPTI